jgi:hypothetical protein
MYRASAATRPLALALRRPRSSISHGPIASRPAIRTVDHEILEHELRQRIAGDAAERGPADERAVEPRLDLISHEPPAPAGLHHDERDGDDERDEPDETTDDGDQPAHDASPAVDLAHQ